ncbi:hypothetical protein BGM09_00920 [Streptomyces sp. CBMA29]|nr:hypothetical protein [Streptomyces sp. CBMA29]
MIAEPFEIALLFMCLLSGFITLLVSPDNAVRRATPGPFLYVWGAFLCAASATGISGWVVISRSLTVQRVNYGRQMERLSMIMFMWASFVWCGALVSLGWNAVPTATLTAAFGLACGVRAYVIRALIQVHELSRMEAVRLIRRGAP